MIDQWKALLETKARDWDLPAGGTWSFLLFNNYTHEIHDQPECNIDLLWFHGNDKHPRVVTKLCRQPANLNKEFQNMKRAYAHAPAWVPKPLDFVNQGGFWGLWIEGARGDSPLAQDFNLARLQSITKTLASMHNTLRNTATAASGGAERYDKMVLRPLETLQQLGQNQYVRAGCAEMRSRISQQWLLSLPVIPQHGDMVAGNLIADGGRWHVVDWENFALVDFPFYDLLTLLLSLLMVGGEKVEFWDKELVRQIPSLLKSYSGLLDLRPADIAMLLPLTLVNWTHLQWAEDRRTATDRMYRMMQNYFERREEWSKVFMGA